MAIQRHGNIVPFAIKSTLSPVKPCIRLMHPDVKETEMCFDVALHLLMKCSHLAEHLAFAHKFLCPFDLADINISSTVLCIDSVCVTV